jgi:hypothetical protein
MRIIKVIECWVWANGITGAKASIYGAVPWHSPRERALWDLELVGFTWQLSNGTVGLGRTPAKTREQAEEVMVDFNGKLAA